MPGRRTVFISHAACVTAARDVLRVYGSVRRVLVGVRVDIERVSEAQSRIASLLEGVGACVKT
jgi:hypothetical protein